MVEEEEPGGRTGRESETTRERIRVVWAKEEWVEWIAVGGRNEEEERRGQFCEAKEAKKRGW